MKHILARVARNTAKIIKTISKTILTLVRLCLKVNSHGLGSLLSESHFERNLFLKLSSKITDGKDMHSK